MTYYDAEIEYLESTGMAFIDTEIIPILTYSVECQFYYVSPYNTVNDASASLFGCFSAWNSKMFAFVQTPSKNQGYNCWGNKSTYPTVNASYWNSILNNWHILTFRNKSTYIDGTIYGSTSTGTGNPENNLYVFCVNYNNNTPYGRGTTKRIKTFKLYNENNNLILDLIPVRIGSVGYMYDKVSDRLFGNAGTGSFTLGPDVAGWPGVTGKPKVSSIRRLMIQLMPKHDSKYQYIQDGLVFHLDGINKGNDETKWTDLIGGIYFPLNTLTTVNDDNIQFKGNTFITGNKNIIVPFTEGTIEVCLDGNSGDGCIFMNPNNQALSFMIYNSGYTIKPSQSPNNQFKMGNYKYGKFTGSFISSLGLVNGNKLTTMAKDNWQPNNKYPTIGGRNTGTRYYYTGKVYSIRLYNRQLTEDEMLHNQQVDNIRFHLGLNI